MSFNPGGGGGVSGAADVALSNPASNDRFTYDGATQKWKNAPVTKTELGIGNVDNTSDAAKPVSAAQQAALDTKAPVASPTFTGTVTVPDNSFTIAKTVGLQTALNNKLNANPYVGYIYVRPSGDTTSIPADAVPGMLILNRLS